MDSNDLPIAAGPDAGMLAERLAGAELELEALREELETTNRGVVALYAELDDQAERLRHA